LNQQWQKKEVEIMLKRKKMFGLIVALLAVAGIAMAYNYYRKKKLQNNKKNDCNDETGPKTISNITYDDLFELDTENSIPNSSINTKKQVSVVAKLRNRNYWSINWGVIVSCGIIVLFAFFVVYLSFVCQNYYTNRKINDVILQEQKQLEIQKIQQERIEHEKEFINELYNHLDSIDAHIKQLKPISKPITKKKLNK
jgi:ABC-type multidrug transport system fused ATPase/permease subunit